MLQTRSKLLRVALLSSLGLAPLACEPHKVSQCLDAGADLAEGGVPSGLYRCTSGMTHRPKEVSCENRLPEHEPREPASLEDPESSSCSAHAECTKKPYGFCGTENNASGVCLYGCTKDADCDPNQICVCGPSIGRCRDATCTSDADCAEGERCADYTEASGFDCRDLPRFACQTPADQCAVDTDCGGREYCSALSGKRECKANPGVTCGRPFLVDAKPRLAQHEARPDWLCMQAPPDLSGLSTSQRVQLAEAWLHIGLMEHASIAAFARFALQLLSLGAPAELVQACSAAIGDETRHAQMAFAVASAYRGESLGPSALSLDGAFAECSLVEIVNLVFAEGCVGETLAALEASEAHAGCKDDAIRPLLATIARDEAGHAALAWRFLRWALQREPALAESVHAQLEAIARELAQPLEVHRAIHGAQPLESYSAQGLGVQSRDFDFDAAPYGVVDAPLRARVRRAALRDVVLPCARALLTSVQGPPNAHVIAASARASQSTGASQPFSVMHS